jgi:hypothetical protein
MTLGLNIAMTPPDGWIIDSIRREARVGEPTEYSCVLIRESDGLPAEAAAPTAYSAFCCACGVAGRWNMNLFGTKEKAA